MQRIDGSEGHAKHKMDGNKKKTEIWQKKGSEKKKCDDGPWVESTLDPSKKALRAAL